MRVYLYIGLVVCFFVSCRKKEDVLEGSLDSFVKFYGTSLNQSAVDVQPTSDGGYLILATTQTLTNGKDVYLVKVNQYGNPTWTKVFGGPNDDVASRIIQSVDGSVYVCGYYSMTTDKDAYVLKLNSSGVLIWEKHYGGRLDQVANELVLSNDGKLAVLGYTTIGNPNGNVDGVKDAWLLFLNTSGDSLSSVVYGGPSDDEGNDIVTKSTGSGYIIAATTSSFAKLGSNQAGKNIMIIDIDQTGSENAITFLGGPGEDVVKELQIVDNGKILIGANTNDTPDGSVNMCLIELEGDGDRIYNTLFQKKYGTAAPEDLSGIAESADQFLIVGTTSGYGNGAEDINLITTDKSGNEISNKTFGSESSETGIDIAKASSSGWIILGNSGFEGNQMIQLIKTRSDGSL